ncbi:DUF4054 domain-containing protein [Methylobacterium sp. NMS14P]|uniref:DUF4054 domain-containing protein n=1 Tax=Methylobacterium sp. NMS14P TaxID=2894310 RepID=UPI002359B3D3|nr:DUF4054 domain-containing protein [Methylobacterium sp. NMS14P]WCS27241.1 DUF4054 domain-containing protein [Methylobacterium sp. NMS14P]
MTLARADLVAAFPEFGSVVAFPDATVAFWLGQAGTVVDATRYGAQGTLAQLLFAAHYLVLAAQSARAALIGGGANIGAPITVATSKSVGPVSKGVDAGLTSIAGAGEWNATSYGQRYYQIIRGFAGGPRYTVPGRTPLGGMTRV